MRTRVTLLVVALVALVVLIGWGLLAAAVPRTHAAAARVYCKNNLKQLGFALESYHDAFRAYPSATAPVAGLHPDGRLSWIVTVLPFLGQVDLVIDPTRAWYDGKDLEPRGRYRQDREGPLVERPLGELYFFHCPANPAVAPPHSPGLTHYVGVAGVGADAAGLPAGDPAAGLFGHERKTSTEDVKDGLGTTMAVLETTDRNGPWTAGGFPTVRGLDPAGGPYLGDGGQFGSNHPRGDLFARTPPRVTHAAFLDGSVRPLSSSLDPRVFEALATLAGGEAVSAADW